jgi:hypothetical protein
MVNLSRTGNQVCNELQQRAGSAMGKTSSCSVHKLSG